MAKVVEYIFLSFIIVYSTTTKAQSYSSYIIGDTTNVIVNPQWAVCLMGGATENDSAMLWFLQKANGGDVLVLRATGADGYNSYMYNLQGANVNSVQTLVVPSTQAANDNYVKTQILNAEAIFIAGGNQADYVSFWKNTALDSALNFFVQIKKGAIGGTSAGMAILGDYYFSALNGTITSSAALSNPFHSNITLGVSDFIKHPFLKNTITDTHYDNPDRKGRHSVFIARLSLMGEDTVYGIACDEYTAVCIDSNKIARVFGEAPQYDDNAYFIQINCEVNSNSPEIISPNQALTWDQNNKAIKVCQVKGTPSGSFSFDLNDWKTHNGGQWYNWYIQNGSIFTSISTSPQCNLLSIQNETFVPDLIIYPNPTINSFKINLPNDDIYRVEILNINGQFILQTHVNEVNLNNLSKGIYLVKITRNNGHVIFKKLIKE
ncbi:MAG: T9SS type A sorting domain-containing protein [Bacteroidia bacterium]